MNILSRIWLNMSFLFDPVQKFFNGNFWKVFAKKIGTMKNKKIVDLACGTGELRKHVNPKYFIGVDFNNSYIDYCERKLKDKSTEFVIADITKYKPRTKIDTTFFIGALHHLSDKQAHRLFANIQKYNTKEFFLIDGIPYGILTPVLMWLDGALGGGKYFRTVKEIDQMLAPYFKTNKQGKLKANASFYYYPYWSLKPRKI